MKYEDDLYDLPPAQPLWTAVIAAGLAQQAGEALEELCSSFFLRNRDSADGDIWDIHLVTEGAPDAAEIEKRLEALGIDAELTAEPVAETDWLQAVHRDFPPLALGGFFVFGSHCADVAVPANLIPLQIDAATAFGSGEHETTQGCLLALEKLKADGFTPRTALDMGCGSGILAIAIKKLWPDSKVAAVDIDPESVTVTERHAAMNQTELSAIEAGDGYAAPCVAQFGPFDLIVANILAGPLVRMAGELNAALAPQGKAVLSGLLARQMDEVVAAHTALGLPLLWECAKDEWRALTLGRA
jgi:ribosomal protein L11 methyltransferase